MQIGKWRAAPSTLLGLCFLGRRPNGSKQLLFLLLKLKHIPDWKCGRPPFFHRCERQNRRDLYERRCKTIRPPLTEGLECEYFYNHAQCSVPDFGSGLTPPHTEVLSNVYMHRGSFPHVRQLLHQVQRLCKHQSRRQLQVLHRLRPRLALVLERREDRRQQRLPRRTGEVEPPQVPFDRFPSSHGGPVRLARFLRGASCTASAPQRAPS